MESNLKSESQLTLIELYRIFKINKKIILFFTGIIFILIIVVVFFVMTPIFQSIASVKTTSKTGGLSGLLGEGMPDLSDFSDLTGGGGSVAKELALYENILISRTCVEETIIKFNLNEEWKFKYMQDAVKNFRENIIDIQKDKIAGTMQIGIFDENPQRAKEVADFMISQLNRINIELNVKNAKNNREFVEARYNTAQNDLRRAEDSLKMFQDIYGVAPDLTIKAAVTAELQLETEIKSEEVKLEILRKILSPDQAEIKAQEEKIIALNNQLVAIRNNSIIDNNLNLKGSPDVAINFLRLQRSVEIQNKILSFVLPLYEQAKIEEKKEMPSVLVLDPPSLPEKKAKPKRMVIVLLVTSISFLFTYLFFVVKDKWIRFKKTANRI